nr:energy-coupling factor transporter transmembrane component T [Schumannella luteola]
MHHLNPLATVLGPLPAMVLLLFTRSIPQPLAFLAIAVLLLVVGAAVAPRRALGLVVAGLAMVVLLTVSFGFWADPRHAAGTTVLLRIGDYRLLEGSLLTGLATALRLTAVVALTLIGGLTSSGVDLVRALIQHLRMPYRIGYTALAAFRFVPRFRYELDVIRAAHRVRGMTGGRGPVAAVRRQLGYVIPLLAGAIRHAERVAHAMDSRAFGAFRTRTERHRIPFRARDVVFIVLFWVATAAILLLL